MVHDEKNKCLRKIVFYIVMKNKKCQRRISICSPLLLAVVASLFLTNNAYDAQSFRRLNRKTYRLTSSLFRLDSSSSVLNVVDVEPRSSQGWFRIRKPVDEEKELSELKIIQSKYDGNQISAYYSRRPLVVWERVIQIGSPIMGWWFMKKFDNITAPFRNATANQNRLNIRAADLKESIVQGKSVTFIKSGQALALRPDIVKSSEYIRELQKLQDEVGTFDNNIAMQIIQDELGVPADCIYSFNPPVPIASASIGQVYKATLKSNNVSVAVKVQASGIISSSKHLAFNLNVS